MNPRFYVGALDEATYTASLAADASFPLDNLSDYIPANLWKSSANTDGQTLKIDFGAARPRDFCVLDQHNFSGMTTVSLQAADDSAYSVNLTTVVTSLVGSNKTPLKFEFTAVSKRYWRILFTTTNATIPQLGQIFIDQKVSFTSFEFGFKPLNEDFESVVSRVALSGLKRTSRSYAGRLKYEMSWKNVDNRWLEDYRWVLQKTQGAPLYFWDHDDNSYYLSFEKPYNPAQVNAYKINDSPTIPFESQGVAQNAYTMQTYPMACDFDGSTENASKTTPVNLDMNGSEQILASNNRDFEVSVGDWQDGGGNHTITRTTTSPIVGTGSGLIAATGAGNQATNHVKVEGGYAALELGKKYTIELLANSDTAATTLTIALNASGQTKVSGTLTTTPGSGTKVVFNFIAAANDTATSLRLFSNQAANLRIDSVSVTEAYDFTALMWAKTIITGYNAVCGRYRISSFGNPRGYDFGISSGNKFAPVVGDDVDTGTNRFEPLGTSNINDGLWKLLALSATRTGNGLVIVNGVQEASASMSGVGKLSNLATLYVGNRDATAGTRWDGQIGELQIIRGYAMTAAQILNIYNTTGILKGYDPTAFPGINHISTWRWKGVSDTDFLKDESGYNNLTGTNVTQVLDQATGTYRIAEL